MKVSVLEVGSCQHPEKMVLPTKPGSRWGNMTFPATVILAEHPKHGLILFDTGYAPRMFEACGQFPESLYLKVTPVSLPTESTLLAQLDKQGIQANDIDYVVVSHFHADHIAGLKDFTKAKYVYLESAISDLLKMGRIQGLKNAFLPRLIPNDFSERSLLLESISQKKIPYENSQFQMGWDLFNDGSVFIVELPGHARGQVGAIFKDSHGKKYFCVADACWSRDAFENLWMPSFITRLIHSDFKEYKQTINRIHHFDKEQPEVLVIPCHCSKSIEQMKEIEGQLLEKGQDVRP